MRCYTHSFYRDSGALGVPGEDHIAVDIEPYPRVILGRGGNKRATWIPLGRRDADQILASEPVTRDGEVTGQRHMIRDVGVAPAKTQKGEDIYLLIAPRKGERDRALVLWRVASGYRGGVEIAASEGAVIVAQDCAYHSGQGSLGSTAEVLAILEPGQQLTAERSGRRVQLTHGYLRYSGGGKFDTRFGGEFVLGAEEIGDCL